jgi:hypothetical protein
MVFLLSFGFEERLDASEEVAVILMTHRRNTIAMRQQKRKELSGGVRDCGVFSLDLGKSRQRLYYLVHMESGAQSPLG